jgi:drug/metabolite transporter (DMT)-like permease
MIYVLANIVFASAFMLTIKWVQIRKREDVIATGAVGYVVAMALAIPEFSRLELERASFDAIMPAMLAGAAMGSCYFVCFFFVNYSIRWIGAAASTVIAVLSILLPIATGVLVWGERPAVGQGCGIAIALISLLLIGAQRASYTSKRRPWFAPFILLVFFLLAGTSRLAQESFKHVCDPRYRPLFLLAAFLMAALPSLALLVSRRKRVLPGELLFGSLLGTANVLQTHCILKSLQSLDGFIVFPVTSAGGLVLTTLVATGFLGERLTRRTILGIVLAAAAMFLLYGSPGGAASIVDSAVRPQTE